MSSAARMTNDGALVFPCLFPIKVFGSNDESFRAAARSVVEMHHPDLVPERITEKVSRDGTYVSLTFNITAQDQDSLDELYRELTACPEVLMAL